MKQKNSYVLTGILLVAIVGLSAWLYVTLQDKDSMLISGESSSGERKVLYWHDPMVPGYRSDRPGKSPFMDMDLVPVYEDEAGAASVVTIRPEVVNNLGVRSHVVEKSRRPHRLLGQGFLFRRNNGNGTVYMLADVFEYHLDWLKQGLPAKVRVTGLPGREWSARITRVERDLDVGARSLQVTLKLEDIDPALRANQSAEALIEGPAHGGEAIFIPSSALIMTGSRTAVILALGEGRFQPVEVIAGPERDGWVEILSGLSDGQRVVVSGQFLIDSEANLRSSLERMESQTAAGEPQS